VTFSRGGQVKLPGNSTIRHPRRTTIQLSVGLAPNPRTWPILDGRVQPEGIELVPSTSWANELFWRQLKFADFDLSEMSMSSLLIAASKGDQRWVGLPIFTTRCMFHTWMLVRKSSGILTPADLKGRRVGVPEYQQTAALWSRGVLQHEFGVHFRDIEFHMERLPTHSHAGGTQSTAAPGGATIHQIPREKNIGQMLLDGELDATLLYIQTDGTDLVDRSTADFSNHPDIVPMFPSTEGARYFEKTGLLHINHMMVIRREIAERHPWVLLNIYKAFQEANAIAERERAEHVEYHALTGLASPALDRQLIQHGVAANRNVLETIAQYSFEQGLTPRLIDLAEIFPPVLLNQ
jgi:4,5-dihydroxyphthalate decarboxylase